MHALWQDIRIALRSLRKRPGFTLAAVVTLAVAIGANTTVFSVVSAVLLEPLPYPEPERLVAIWGRLPLHGFSKVPLSEPELLDCREQALAFEGVAATTVYDANVSGGDSPEHVLSARVSANMLRVLGVDPVIGHHFTAHDGAPDANPVVTLSYGFWQRSFGSDPGIIGRTIKIDGVTHTVVAVMPRGFKYLSEVDIWVPLRLDPANPGSRGNREGIVVGRIRPEATFESARAQLHTIAERLKQQYPANYPQDSGWDMFPVPLHEQVVGDVRSALLIMFGAVGFVLLIACANLATLQLARTTARGRELAIRAALGARNHDIVRMLLIESLVLSLLGGAFGLILASFGTDAVVSLGLDNLPRSDEVGVNSIVVVFTGVVSVLSAIIFGLVPALGGPSEHLPESLKEATGRTTTEGLRNRRARGVLVGAEVALALVLLIGAGLMIRSFARLLEVDPGFNPSSVLTFRVSLPSVSYAGRSEVVRFFEELIPRLEALPGVSSAGAVSVLPFSGTNRWSSITPQGQILAQGEEPPVAERHAITPGYLRSMTIPVLAGRTFTEEDHSDAAPVAIVDEEFAERFWSLEEAVGKRIKRGGPDSGSPWRTIVGVVGTVQYEDLATEAGIQVYFPHAQLPMEFMWIVVRTFREPTSLVSAVRSAVSEIDPDLPLADVRSMPEVVSAFLGDLRISVALFGLFAGIAVALAAVGVYGVVSYSVSRRHNEIGIRTALGASSGDILWLSVRQGMLPCIVGIALGLVGSFLVTRIMESLLFEVSPADPVTFIAAAVLLTLIALLANLIPARRAAKAAPLTALQRE
jgi:predicted permease